MGAMAGTEPDDEGMPSSKSLSHNETMQAVWHLWPLLLIHVFVPMVALIEAYALSNVRILSTSPMAYPLLKCHSSPQNHRLPQLLSISFLFVNKQLLSSVAPKRALLCDGACFWGCTPKARAAGLACFVGRERACRVCAPGAYSLHPRQRSNEEQNRLRVIRLCGLRAGILMHRSSNAARSCR